MNVNQIRSVGVLNNWDGTVAISICLKYRMYPVFVTLTKNQFESVGRCAGLIQSKQKIVDLFNVHGSGRP